MKKLISFIATSAILLNSLVTPLSILAQEVSSTPTPEPTPVSTDSPQPLAEAVEATIAPTEQSTPTPDAISIDITTPSAEEVLPVEIESQVAESSATLVVSEPQPVEKVYLSNSQTIIDTVGADWDINDVNGSAETKEAVKLGVKYIFPLNDKVTVTFKSLPTNESLRTTIKIVKVKVSDLNLPDNMSPYGEYAYDITTDMADGSFDYDLTLPKPDGQSVDVAYMENTDSTPLTIAGNQTSQEGGTVKASDINHFTIFVAVNPNPAGNGSASNNTCLTAAAGGVVTCYDTIQAAINAASNGDTIEIQSDIVVGQQINVNKDVTIDGNGFTVNPNFVYTNNSNNSTFGIHSSGVTISNLTVDGTSGTNLHGINIYMVNNVLLDGVSVLNNDKSGITVNGSIVTVNNITTAGNGWGGINVDQGSGVTTEAKLIITGTSSHNETAHIWLDNITKDVSVQDTHPKQYVYQDYGNKRIYTLKTASNPSADLDQWGNEAPIGWQNGNLNGNQADYFEGDSVAYRMKFDNLSLSSHTVTIGWDTTKSGKHALDYLTNYDQTETTDPCSGISGCTGPASAFPIPADLNISTDSNWTGSQIPGNFSLFGGTITGVSSYNLIGSYSGDSETQITITFTASQDNPVLAWGGHIATRANWGQNNSAVSISGSPYHMRLRGLDGSGGNQDRSLASEAVIYPATITVTKDAVPDNAQDFSFTTSGTELSDFSLDDDSDSTLANQKVFTITNFTSNNGDTKTITESPQGGWLLTGLICNDNNGSVNPGTRTATLSVVEGENIACTFTNTIQNGHIIVDKATNPAGSGQSFAFITTGSGYSGFSLTDSSSPNNQELVPGNYGVTETGITGWDLTNTTCVSSIQDTETAGSLELDAGETITCTFTNTQRGKIFGYKYDDANGDGQDSGDWTPVVGWVIELWQNNSKVDQTSTTTGGYYEFTNWVLGSYEVKEQVSNGWTNITPTTLPVTLTAGESDGPNNFVNFNLGQISGKKYEDLNGNGENDTGEPSLQGWLIYIDANNNGQLDSGERSTSTDPNGNYTFSDLGPGTYVIREEVKQGWAQTDPTGLDSAIGGQSDGSYVVVMTSNSNKTQRNFGNQMRGSITITKSAIPQDEQNFGFTSPQLGNFTLNDDGNGSDSYKIFPNLGSNTNGITYTITEDLTTGWKLTNISCTGDEDVAYDVNGRTVTLTLDHPSENVSCEFTNIKLGSISGFKYAQGSQVPLTGWTISLYQNQTLLTSQVTTAGGYKFDNLLPGAYSLSEGLLSGWTQISIPSSVVITAGQDSTNNNFINFLNGNIAGYKWSDLDGNGVWDSGEPPIQGWKIYLDRPDGPDIYDLTNASGHYYFGDLGPGTYRVYEEVQPTWTQTAPSSSEYIIDMTQGAQGLNNPNYNFGNRRLPVTIKGYKVICENESDLPNWGNHGATIDADTAQDYVDSHPSCSLSEDWDFQYGPSGAGIFGSFQTDTNSLAGSWNTFNVSSDATINDLSNFGGRIEVREVFPDNTYLPFSNSNDFSAEFYCSGDTYNYDNWEWINNPQYDQTYHCVAFNTLNPGRIIVDKVTDPEGDPQIFTFDPSWSENNFTLTDQDEPLNSGPLAPGVYSVSELKQEGWSLEDATCDNKNSVGEINLQPGEIVTCTFNNLKLNPNIIIAKSNDKSGGTMAGSTVTYTLTVTNNGNVDLQGVDITDILPGGFSFVTGSTTGTAVVPTVSGSVITWSSVGDLAVGASLILTYQATIYTDSTNGLYTNFATCDSYYYDGDEERTSVPCNTANSTVSIGSVLGYSGSLQGQVLGASTELPATGSPTLVLIVALVMLATGLFLNGFTKRETIKIVTVKRKKKAAKKHAKK